MFYMSREDLRGKELTQRELDVAYLVKKAMTNRGIADRLGLTEDTIKQYLYAIYSKLGINTRTELALWGLRNCTDYDRGVNVRMYV